MSQKLKQFLQLFDKAVVLRKIKIITPVSDWVSEGQTGP